MKVLHVDPDADSRSRVRVALPGTVEGVADAAAARCALRDGGFDCVVTELSLPDADGLEFLAAVAADDRRLVVYTSAGDEGAAGDAVAAGADAYVPKPDRETLVTRVFGGADRVPADGSQTADGSGPPVTNGSRPVEADPDSVGTDRAAADGTTAAGGGERSAAEGSPDGVTAPVPGELVVEQAPLAVIQWNRSFEVVDWNPAAEALFGYDAEEAVGRDLGELVVPTAAREEVATIVEDLLAGEGGHYSVNENVRADGSTVTCEWHNVIRRNADGEVVGVISFARDVTARERRTDRLESLGATAKDLLRAETREAVAETVVDAASDLFGQPLAGVRLYDDETGRLEPVAVSDAALAGGELTDVPSVGPGDGPLWECYEAGERRIVAAADGSSPAEAWQLGVESLLVEPMGEHGLLVYAARETDAFDETDAYLASSLAATAAAAIDRADRQAELRRYETIVEAAGDAVFAIDAEGRFVEVNDRMLELSGYDREALLGVPAERFLADADLERAREHLRRLRGGEADFVTYEIDFEAAGGKRVPLEVNQSLLPGDGFEGTVGTARDISARKQMERRLREGKRKIQALHDVASELDDCGTPDEVGRVTVEAARKVLDFDECVLRRRTEAGFELLGATTDDAPAVRPDDGLYGATVEEGRSRVVADLRALELARDNPWAFRSVLSVPVGETGVLQAVSRTVDAFDDRDRELAELLASHAADALDRIAAEEELRAERDRLAALFDNVPDPVVAATHGGGDPTVTAVNPAFEETFGYDATEIVGENLDDYIVPPGAQTVAIDVNERASDGAVVEREVRRRTADGLRDFRLTVVPVELGADDPETFGVYTDVTERKQRRKRVEVLNRVLRHDLRNGMNIVRGEAELLADKLDTDAAGHARTILDRADELLQLAERTRAVERSLDRDTSTAGPVDLAVVAREAGCRLRERFPEADLTVEAPGSAIVAGERLLELAVFDAIENAIVHNDRETPSVDVTVEHDGDDIVVRVADDGPGIPEAERALLTDEQEITQLHHGSGLGLWLVHWSVTHSGGELSFADRTPRGSVVTMRLPAAAGSDSCRSDDKEE